MVTRNRPSSESLSKARSADVISILLFVVDGSPPEISSVAPAIWITAAHPPGPGLPMQDPSVWTSDFNSITCLIFSPAPVVVISGVREAAIWQSAPKAPRIPLPLQSRYVPVVASMARSNRYIQCSDLPDCYSEGFAHSAYALARLRPRCRQGFRFAAIKCETVGLPRFTHRIRTGFRFDAHLSEKEKPA